jgi:hypothetical protein
MPAKVNKLGPGTLKVGELGTEVDFSCQVTAAHVDTSVDEADDTIVLCGDTIPGARTYSYALAGTLLQDLDAAGIVALSWETPGAQVPFEFIPVTAGAAKVAGTLILDPLTIGGEEAGQNMTSDFEWAIVGTPTFTPATVSGLEAEAETEEAVGAAA